MANARGDVSTSEVIPIISSDVFAGEASGHRFAVGLVATDGEPTVGLGREFEGYFDLRKKVYVDQKGFLSQEDLADDGRDRDADDARSVAFTALENAGSGLARVVGSMRLIVKGDRGFSAAPLPVEHHWPEVFDEEPAGPGSIEVSRLISRHEDDRVQDMVKWGLYTAGLAYVITHGLKPTYGIIEEGFERTLNSKVPSERVGNLKQVDRYNTMNVAVRIDTETMAVRLEERRPGELARMQEAGDKMVYFGRYMVQAA